MLVGVWDRADPTAFRLGDIRGDPRGGRLPPVRRPAPPDRRRRLRPPRHRHRRARPAPAPAGRRQPPPFGADRAPNDKRPGALSFARCSPFITACEVAMPVPLLSEATIHLFGRGGGRAQARQGSRRRRPHRRAGSRSAARRPVARIYAFAFQNEYVDLASPALFLVSGAATKWRRRSSSPVSPGSPMRSTRDLMVWKVERDDLTIRLDVMTGSLRPGPARLRARRHRPPGLRPRRQHGSGPPTAVSTRARRRPRGWRSDDD